MPPELSGIFDSTRMQRMVKCQTVPQQKSKFEADQEEDFSWVILK
jgi:hypothetical protein